MTDSDYRHPELQASSLFSEFWGPSGAHPVQLAGTLATGEYVYFRARGRKATLVIFPSQKHWQHDNGKLAEYSKVIEGDDDFPASIMPVEDAALLVSRWLADYRSGITS